MRERATEGQLPGGMLRDPAPVDAATGSGSTASSTGSYQAGVDGRGALVLASEDTGFAVDGGPVLPPTFGLVQVTLVRFQP